ncbi:hypothetical protein BBJ28_00020161 [Nothophytophthora sp. Chile5]|nr:hypothetical protein BBJ28_00020161 [Nothophytophthora sp. Chile5]
MKPPGVAFATAEWSQTRRLPSSPVASAVETTPVKSRPGDSDPAALGPRKQPSSTWPPEQACRQRSQMVAAWQTSGDVSKLRQMHESHVAGVPRSVLSRLFALPSAGSGPGSSTGSPRRRCSAAVAALVHSPRAFTSSSEGDREANVMSSPQPQCYSPMHPASDFASFGSGSNCSSRCGSPLPMNQFAEPSSFADGDEADSDKEEVLLLRQQVALLMKSLEDEKKRRTTEQHLMQTVSLIRTSLPGEKRDADVEMEPDVGHGACAVTKTSPSSFLGLARSSARENERGENNQGHRRWSAPVDDEESGGCQRKKADTSGEAAAKLQLTKLRARMHAVVIDTQRETQSLRAQLEGAKRTHNKREKQLQLETSIKLAALEHKHTAATTRLAQQAANGAAQVAKLEAEKQELLANKQAYHERLEQLELALGGKQIVEASRWT